MDPGQNSLRPLGLAVATLALVALGVPSWASTAIFDVDFTNGTVPPGDGASSSHTFYAEAGDAVMLRAVRASPIRPELKLLDPDLVEIGVANGENVAWLTRDSWNGTELTKTGTYTIRVLDAPLTQPPPPAGGAYKLYATRAPYSNEEGTLTNGGKVERTIDYGDIDSFTFEADAGDGVRIRMVEVNDTFDFNPELRLLAPDGTFVRLAVSERVADLRSEGWNPLLPQTGTYTLLAFDANASSGTAGPIGTGPYEVHLAHMPGAQSNGYLLDGVMSSDDVELGEMDTYQIIVGAAGSTDVDFIQTGGSLVARADVYDPSGDYYSFIVPPGNAFFSFPTAGTWTILVSDFSPHDRTGSYELTVNGAGLGPPAVPMPAWLLGGVVAALALLARWRLAAPRA